MARKPSRWKRRKDARPAEIVAAALDVFAERGFSATRLEEVAERAGVSKGTVYLYFANKEDLFKAVVRQALVPTLAKAETQIREHPASARDQLAELFATMVGTIATPPAAAIPKLVIAESRNFPDIARFYLEEVISRGFRLLAGIIERGIATGEFRPIEVDHAVRLAIAPVLLTALWKTSFEPAVGARLDAGPFLKTHFDVLIHGLAADRPAS